MGNLVSWFQSMFEKKNATILMVGLDAAGKTTILNKLKLNEVKETVPTIGFNVETVEYRNVKFHVWDVGGQARLRTLWKHYYDGANAIIYVIDSNDRDRMGVAKDELDRLLKDPMLAGASLLVLCNKQDLPQRLVPSQVLDVLNLKGDPELTRGRMWYVQGCCAHSGEGLFEGLDWMCSHLPNNTAA
jgi:ADP-ribosylation factor protein 1